MTKLRLLFEICYLEFVFWSLELFKFEICYLEFLIF